MENNTCKLIPLEGLEWNGQMIRLGDTKNVVEQVFGPPDRVFRSIWYYHRYDIRFDLAADDTVAFIECIGGVSGKIQPEIFGVSAFQTDADELFALLSERNGPDIDDSEAEYAYALRNLSIGLYREITPAAVEEMVREIANIDVTKFPHFNLEEENQRARHWETIGIGIKGYYA